MIAKQKTVQFGLNVFSVPRGFVFGKGHDIAKWRAQAKERRERIFNTTSDSSHEVTGQELNPQNQKQQITAKVEAATKNEIVQLANKLFPDRPLRLEQIFEPGERKLEPTKKARGQALGPKISLVDLREQMKSLIVTAEAGQLKKLTTAVQTTIRSLVRPGTNDVSRPVIDRVNYGSRQEVIGMYLALCAANKTAPKLCDAGGNLKPGKPGEQQLQEEQIRAHMRYAVLAMMDKPAILAKTCEQMMKAADQRAPGYDMDASPKVA